MAIRAFSSGGGVQSIAALVLSVRGAIDYPLHIFANVGNDSEHPATLEYIRDVAIPYAAANNIEFIEVHKTLRDGTFRTLLEETSRHDVNAIKIPVRMPSGMPGVRGCTKEYKSLPIAKELKRRGANNDNPARLGLGISIDEYQRMNVSRIPWQVFEYPLIDLRLSRMDCISIIQAANLPVPPKSACYFCPFLSPARWRLLKKNDPDLFMNAVVLELDINAKRRRMGKHPVYLTRFGKPLSEAIDNHQSSLDFEDDTCESGYCMT